GVANRAPCLVEPIELAALLEERRLGRIEVLGLAFADDAAAESDHVAARVEDRKHDALAKAVVTARLLLRALGGLAIDDEPGVLELARRIVGEHRREVLPSLGRVADAVAGGDLARDAAALEVIDCRARFLELGAVVGERV